MFSIIIPSYKNPKYLDFCLNSIIENQTFENQIIAIIDGYVDMYKDVFKKYRGKVDFLKFDENRGMQTAINLGVYNSDHNKLLIINEDNVFAQKWDEKLQDLPIVNTVWTINQIEPFGPGMFNFPVVNCGTDCDKFDVKKFHETEKELSKNESTDDGHIFPFIIHKSNFMIVNGFDTLYDSAFVCDWDFFLKLELAQCTFKRTHRTFLYHFGSKSTKNREGEDCEREFVKGQHRAVETFRYKWGCSPRNGKDNCRISPELIKKLELDWK